MYAELSWRGRSGLVTADEVPVATLRRALLAERVRADINGLPWTVARSWGEIVATDPSGVVRHRARGQGVWRRHWSAKLNGRTVHLDRAGSRRWRLRDTDDSGVGSGLLGELRVAGAFRYRVLAELPDGTSPDVATFLLWLAFALDTRRRAAVAGG